MWGRRNRLARRTKVAAILGALLLPGCGSRSGLLVAGEAEQEETSPEVGVADDAVDIVAPAHCVDDWQTLYKTEASLSPALGVTPGEVVFGQWEVNASFSELSSELRALDRSGLRPFRVLADAGFYENLWIEGDAVLYWRTNQLFQVPLAGGVAAVLLDGRPTSAPTEHGDVLVQPDVFYWTELDRDGSRTNVWRQGRRRIGQEYAERELVTFLDQRDFSSSELGRAKDGLIVAGRHAVAIADADASQTRLANVEDSSYVGLDASGVYYSRIANGTPRGGEAFEYEILRAPVDGGAPTRFWRGPAGHALSRLWASGSGWLGTGNYYLDDRRPHSVVVQIDADGTEHILACAPDTRSIVGRPVFSDGSLYLITEGPGALRRIVAVALTPAGSAAPR